MELSGKVALVTGASRGVGAAAALALAEAGCDLACAARSTRSAPQKTPGTLDDTIEKIRARGRRALGLPTNLADPEQVVKMVQATLDHYGRIDILLNNAAITFVGDLGIPLSRYDLVMKVNLSAPLIATREVVPHMASQGSGAIVNISSVAALYPHPGLMTYGISKIALERLTVDVACQVARHGIAVNCFRIDIPVASEGFIANTPRVERSSWEPCEVAAEGILWMLRQPPAYSGQLVSMFALRESAGIMRSRASKPFLGPPPPVELHRGLRRSDETEFA